MNINYPAIIILDTKYIIEEYIKSINNILSQNDLIEVLTQICDNILNNRDEWVLNCNYLLDSNFINNQQYVDATWILSNSIRHKLYLLNSVINDNFPYMFSRLLGKDIVFSHLPY